MNNQNTAISNNNELFSDNYIVFSVNEQKYGISINNVTEIINLPYINILKEGPIGVIGNYNYKGLLIQAVDLCPFTGQNINKINADNQLIIINLNGQFFSVLSEKIINTFKLAEQMITSNFPYDEDNIIKKIYKDDSNVINIIDLYTLNKLINFGGIQSNRIDYLQIFDSSSKSIGKLKARLDSANTKQEIYSFNFQLTAVNQYVLFSCDNKNYYIDLKYVKEFSNNKKYTIRKLPYTKDYIKGIININGEFVLAVDLKKFLNTNIQNDDESTNIIIVNGKNYNIALCCDEVKYINNLNVSQLAANSDNHSKYISFEFIENDKLYGILDIEKIINDERLYINID